LAILGAVSVFVSSLIIGLSKDHSKKYGNNKGFSVLVEEEQVVSNSRQSITPKVQMAERAEA